MHRPVRRSALSTPAPAGAGAAWIAPLDRPDLCAGEVHVWRIALATAAPPPDHGDDAGSGHGEDLLSAGERARGRRFRFARDRARFLGRRIALRRILAGYLAIPPADVSLAEGHFTKPRLATPDAPLRFNVAASGDLALVAVCREAEVGIDVERIRDDLDITPLAERSLSPTERTALAAVVADDRARTFFHAWVRKEAYLKAKGVGLSVALDAVSVSLSPTEPARLLHSAIDPRDPRRWRLRTLDAGAAYAAALAAPVGCRTIRLWHWQCCHSEADMAC